MINAFRTSTIGEGRYPIAHDMIIVECGACGQPFAVSLDLFSTPHTGELTVPAHFRLLPSGEVAEVRCDGAEVPASGKGRQSEWERLWSTRHAGRVPDVLDGTNVRVRRIR